MKVLRFFFVIFLFSLFITTSSFASVEGRAVHEIKFLSHGGLYENALVKANFYLETHPASLRVRKLKMDLLIKLSRFDESLSEYEKFIRYSKAKKENISIL